MNTVYGRTLARARARTRVTWAVAGEAPTWRHATRCHRRREDSGLRARKRARVHTHTHTNCTTNAFYLFFFFFQYRENASRNNMGTRSKRRRWRADRSAYTPRRVCPRSNVRIRWQKTVHAISVAGEPYLCAPVRARSRVVNSDLLLEKQFGEICCG